MEIGLSRELRENADYLSESGWKSSARLMLLAAAEIERLSARVAKLEHLEDGRRLRTFTVALFSRLHGRHRALAARKISDRQHRK